MTRMMVMTFWGTERFREKHHDHAAPDDSDAHDDAHHSDHGVHEPHESPWTMTVPLIVLAVLSTFGGLIGVPYALGSLFTDHPTNYIERTLEPAISQVHGEHEGAKPPVDQVDWLTPKPQVVDGPSPIHELGAAPESGAEHAHSPEEIRAERLLTVVSVGIALLGIGLGWVVFKKRPLLQMPRLLENKYYVDEAYNGAIINPIKVGSREGLWKLFDVGVIDGLLHTIGDVVTESGSLVRRLQAGFVRGYAALILLGALAIIGFFAYFGVQLIPK
jgi:NADH-quinone oxidoreductase subunit L